MLFCFTVPYYTHYYTYEIMMKVLRSPSSPMDFAGHLTQKHRKSTAKTLKAHYNGIGFWWYNRMYSMVFPYIPMIFWYFMSILFAWCSNDLHIFGVFRGPVAFEPTKILGGWNFCRCGILYATCTERGRDGEGMACGHVVVNDGWLDMWFFLMCFGCFRTGSIHSDVRCFKPDMLIARRSWTCVSPRGTLIKCRVSLFWITTALAPCCFQIQTLEYESGKPCATSGADHVSPASPTDHPWSYQTPFSCH